MGAAAAAAKDFATRDLVSGRAGRDPGARSIVCVKSVIVENCSPLLSLVDVRGHVGKKSMYCVRGIVPLVPVAEPRVRTSGCSSAPTNGYSLSNRILKTMRYVCCMIQGFWGRPEMRIREVVSR